jgi:hypothetical protein
MVIGAPVTKLGSMRIHAPEALRLRTTRRLWPWSVPRIKLQTALFVAVCMACLGAAALVVFVLLQDDVTVLWGRLAWGPTVSAMRL